MHRLRRITLRLLVFIATAVIILPRASLFPQTTNAAPSAASGEDIIPFLNQTLAWHRQSMAQEQLVNEPSDVLFLNEERQIADQVVRFSFDFARARAQTLASQAGQSYPPSEAAATSQYQRVAGMAAKADQQLKQTQQELETMRQKLERTTGKERRTLQATIAETESESALFQARRDAMRSMLQIASGGGTGKLGAGSLTVQVEELARTVPAAADSGKEPGAAAAPPPSHTASPATLAATEHKGTPSGILALISDLFALRHKTSTLDDNLRLTDSLVQASRELRAPLVAKVRELTQKGDQISAQPDSIDPAVLAQQKKDLDALTAQYKELSASLLPLGKQSILLDLYKRTTGNWRNAVENQFEAELKGLLLRLAGLAVILGAVLAISELWRRAAFRYVTDARRRYQLLLVRRIVVWCVMALIIAIAFASELGAITTFAGLLTAGIVVALQNVILAVAGYFFLIGKHGIRVGDRVQVGGITGDVVDIGMVRLHLMEVSGGTSPRPTGRVVVFSNSVVFQAGAGMFKPIPGTSFLWHEITLTLGPESNYRQAEQRMLDAVNQVYSEYGARMEVQRRSMERSLRAVPSSSFSPESRLRLTASGLDVVIRYPVEVSNAAEIDDRITRELLEAIGREPKLRLLGAQIEAKTA